MVHRVRQYITTIQTNTWSYHNKQAIKRRDALLKWTSTYSVVVGRELDHNPPFHHRYGLPTQKHSLPFLIKMNFQNSSSGWYLLECNLLVSAIITKIITTNQRRKIPDKHWNHIFPTSCSSTMPTHSVHSHTPDPVINTISFIQMDFPSKCNRRNINNYLIHSIFWAEEPAVEVKSWPWRSNSRNNHPPSRTFTYCIKLGLYFCHIFSRSNYNLREMIKLLKAPCLHVVRNTHLWSLTRLKWCVSFLDIE